MRRRIATPDLFENDRAGPAGLMYRPDLLTTAEEQDLLEGIAALELRPFEFHGFRGKRRVASFGWRYDFNDGGLQPAVPIPAFLRVPQEKAAAFAGLAPADLQHALVTEYAPGAPIGWHRDRPEFGDVVGISLLSTCSFRMRRKSGRGWQRFSLRVEPRSAYLLSGPARSEWEHSIPPVEALRYSITFRQLRPGRDRTPR
jgi:alkylated DNA repair dioxygenase AlkB